MPASSRRRAPQSDGRAPGWDPAVLAIRVVRHPERVLGNQRLRWCRVARPPVADPMAMMPAEWLAGDAPWPAWLITK